MKYMVKSKDLKTPKSTNKTTITSKKKKAVIIFTLMGGIGIIIYLYSSWLNYIPRSTLQWLELSELGVSLKEVCAGSRQIYPPTSWKGPFPAFSPDGEYYVDVADARLGRTKVLKLFKADTQQEIGTYYSSYSSLFIHCWAENSTGIFVSDREPGGTGFGIFQRSSKTGPVKKLLVP